MGIKTKIAAAATLILAIAGCSPEETPVATVTVQPAPTPTKTAQKPPVSSSFTNPVVSPQANPTVVANSGIIQSTQVQPRLQEMRPGRTDPFAQIVTNTVAQAPTNSSTSVTRPVPIPPPLPVPIRSQTTTVTQTPRTPQTTSTAKNRTTTPRQAPTNTAQVTKTSTPNGKVALVKKPKPAFKPVLPKLQPQVIAKVPIAPLLPPQPQPDSAKAVLVNGVVLIGKEPQAIIKVPNEPSRYVQAGQRLANGVLIKRIEMNRGSEPVVILEQYGIEVAKTVEGKPTNSDPSKTAATSPVSMITPL
jgi:hypothetical protein